MKLHVHGDSWHRTFSKETLYTRLVLKVSLCDNALVQLVYVLTYQVSAIGRCFFSLGNAPRDT